MDWMWGREKADRSVVKPASWPHPTHGSCGWYPQQGVPVTAPKVLAANTQGVVALACVPAGVSDAIWAPS